jgi:hypothetical protein
MSGNPFLQPGSPGSASRSKTVVRQKYVARQPSQDYFDPSDDDVQGDFSEFEGNKQIYIDLDFQSI